MAQLILFRLFGQDADRNTQKPHGQRELIRYVNGNECVCAEQDDKEQQDAPYDNQSRHVTASFPSESLVCSE